jgi:hypothetical protein
MSDPAHLYENPNPQDESVRMKRFQTPLPRSFPMFPDASVAVKKCFTEKSISFQPNITVLPEGPTGRSKTRSEERHRLPFDETNKVLQTVLQFL